MVPSTAAVPFGDEVAEHAAGTNRSHALRAANPQELKQQKAKAMPAESGAAEMESILAELGASLRDSTHLTGAQKLLIFETFDLDEEMQQLEMDMQTELVSGVALAEGEAGDAKKYQYLVKQMTNRWLLFLELERVEKPPSEAALLELMPTFTSYMFHFRQQRSRSGRQGLGDQVAEAAQKVLAQVSAG